MRRRSRRTQKFDDEIEEELELSYADSSYLTIGKRRKLGKHLGLSEAQVQKWYTERRELDRAKAVATNNKSTTKRRSLASRTTLDESVAATSIVGTKEEESLVESTAVAVPNMTPSAMTGDGKGKKARGRPPKKKSQEESVGESMIENGHDNNEEEQIDANKENVNGHSTKDESMKAFLVSLKILVFLPTTFSLYT